MAVRLSAAADRTIRDAAAAAYPEECCGLLVGIGDVDGDLWVQRAVTSHNLSAGDRLDSFEVDPKVRFDLMRELGLAKDSDVAPPPRIVGHYHSHPDHPAEPSERDRQQAFEPEFVWLIASVMAGEVAALTAHAVTPDGFRRLPLEIESA